MPSAGQGRSGVFASQMWTCESTMMRRARWALAGPDGCEAVARTAPAARVVVRTSRRENMGGLLLLGHSGDALALRQEFSALRAPQRQPIDLVRPEARSMVFEGAGSRRPAGAMPET